MFGSSGGASNSATLTGSVIICENCTDPTTNITDTTGSKAIVDNEVYVNGTDYIFIPNSTSRATIEDDPQIIQNTIEVAVRFGIILTERVNQRIEKNEKPMPAPIM